MRVAVTGAAGFVGGELLRALAAAGHRATPIVRRDAGLPDQVVAGTLEEAEVALLEAGLRGVDAVVHLSARTHCTERGLAGSAAFRRTNVDGTSRLLDGVAAAGVQRIVFVSSIKVNGEQTRPGHRFTGVDEPKPEDEYGRSKHEAERLIARRAGESGYEFAILRPPLVYGAGAKGNVDRLVRAVRRGIPLPLGRVKNRRSIISVGNLVGAIIAALTVADLPEVPLTLSDDADVSTPALIRAIGRAVRREPRLLPAPVAALRWAAAMTGRADEVRRLLCDLRVDSGPAQVALGWTPHETLDDALQRAFASSD